MSDEVQEELVARLMLLIAYRVPAGGKSVFIWEAGWEKPFGNHSTFSCFRNLEILHGHPFVAAYIHGDNA
jgi:hypothetical protein